MLHQQKPHQTNTPSPQSPAVSPDLLKGSPAQELAKTLQGAHGNTIVQKLLASGALQEETLPPGEAPPWFDTRAMPGETLSWLAEVYLGDAGRAGELEVLDSEGAALQVEALTPEHIVRVPLKDTGPDAADAVTANIPAPHWGADDAPVADPAPPSSTSTTSAPPPAPSPSSPVASESTPETCTAGREPDGLVDYYMETHWDSARFFALCEQHGFPHSAPSDALSTIDRMLPTDISPEARTTINIACGIAGGLIDTAILNELEERIGWPVGLARDLLAIGQDVGSYIELDDPVGVALYGGCLLVDGILEAILQTSGKVSGFIGILGLAASTLTPLLGPYAPAVLGEIQAAQTILRGPLQSAVALCNTFQLSLDVIQGLYDQSQAMEAQAAGSFERAAAYKDMMRDGAFDVFEETFSATLALIEALPLVGSVKTAGIVLNNLRNGEEIGLGLKDWKGITGKDIAGFGKLVHEEISDTTGFNNIIDGAALGPGVLLQVDAADQMRLTPETSGHFIERSGMPTGNNYATMLSEARQQTLSHLESSYLSLQDEPPSWYQKLLNELVAPSDPSMKEYGSPTWWIGQLLENLPMLGEFLADTTLEGLALTCELAAGFLTDDLQPFADALTLIFADLKPGLETALVELNDFMQEQEVSLTQLVQAAELTQQAVDALHALAAEDGGLEQTAQEAIAAIEGMRIDPDKLELPAMVPAELVASAVAPINETIDESVALLTALKEEQLTALRTQLTALSDLLSEKVQHFHDAVVVGGSFQTEVQAHTDRLKAMLAEATAAFAQWDGVITFDLSGARAFLEATAVAARSQAARDVFDHEDPWAELVCETAQPELDAWRAQYADLVEAQYHPVVPDWEIHA